MEFKISKEWAVAALTRAIKTICQTALGMITVGVALQDINWLQILSVSAVAGIYCLLTSVVFGVPEGEINGTVKISTMPGDSPLALEFEDEKQFKKLSSGNKSTATFKVEKNV